MIRWAILCAVCALPVQAETLYFACDFGSDRSVSVTHTDTQAVYDFRHPTNSLRLTRDVTDVHLTPWPGVGRTIWEEVIFTNAGVQYLVYASIDRIPPEDETDEIETQLSGGIRVSRGETLFGELTCQPDTIDFPWGSGLYDAKTAAGQCYDTSSREWSDC